MDYIKRMPANLQNDCRPVDAFYSAQVIYQLSLAASEAGIDPAQALRIMRREHPRLGAEIANAKITLSYYDIKYVFDDILDAQSEGVSNPHTKLPEHFLLQTNLTTVDEAVHTLAVPADIHFIRTQRRYNKRRYARVRAVSRPSFWSGMLLSTLATGAFGGASAQNLEWITNATAIPDINMLLLLLYVFIIHRLLRQVRATSAPYSRECNKSRRGIAEFLSRPKSIYPLG